MPRRWRTRLAPGTDALQRPAKGAITLWARARRLLWTWWLWAAACLMAIAYNEWGWVVGFGLLALFTYLAAPQEFPPRYGLDHQFAVD